MSVRPNRLRPKIRPLPPADAARADGFDIEPGQSAGQRDGAGGWIAAAVRFIRTRVGLEGLSQSEQGLSELLP